MKFILKAVGYLSIVVGGLVVTGTVLGNLEALDPYPVIGGLRPFDGVVLFLLGYILKDLGETKKIKSS